MEWATQRSSPAVSLPAVLEHVAAKHDVACASVRRALAAELRKRALHDVPTPSRLPASDGQTDGHDLQEHRRWLASFLLADYVHPNAAGQQTMDGVRSLINCRAVRAAGQRAYEGKVH